MKLYGRAAISDFMDDRIVYRNLEPVDPTLPRFAEFREKIGVPAGVTPRKSQPDYGKVMAYIMKKASEQRADHRGIQELVFIGDTRLNDGNAFANISNAGGWRGAGCIAAENDAEAAYDVVTVGDDQSLFLANRWAMLDDFHQFCQTNGFTLDDRTAVVIDIDKTALGARGRNAHVIDRARVQAVENTVAGLLGNDFDADGFRNDYKRLNQVEFHPFTGDNQDYLAYICLILGSGLFELEQLISDIKTGQMANFEQFIVGVQAKQAQLSGPLANIHSQIFKLVQAGDPTPFKMFRRNELLTTSALMGHLPDDSPISALLADEIVITEEVRRLAMAWKAQGALIFGLSDKPAEASLPTAEQAAAGQLPVHRVQTHSVGI